MTFWFVAAVMLVSGVLTAMQASTNAKLAAAAGSPINAAFVSFAVGTAALLAVALLLRTKPDAAALKALPWYAWIGGLYGAVFVTGAAFAAPRIGVASTLTLLIAGQLLAAVVIDRIGGFGVPVRPVSLARVAGVALVLGGVILVRRG